MDKLGFELFAETKEYLAVNGIIVRSWVQIMVWKGIGGFDCFLDIATGTGTMVRLFLEHWPEGCEQPAVVCLDIDSGALEEVKSQFAAKVTNLELLHSDANQIDLPNKSVDVAVWGNGIHYLSPQDQEQSLQEVRRVLRSDGLLFFNTAFHAESRPAETLPFYRAHVREALKLLHHRNVRRDKGCPRPQASNFLSKSYYEELVSRTGFKLQEIKEYVVQMKQTAWEHISSFPHYAAGALHGFPPEEATKALRQAVGSVLPEYGQKDDQGVPYIPRKWLAVSARPTD